MGRLDAYEAIKYIVSRIEKPVFYIPRPRAPPAAERRTYNPENGQGRHVLDVHRKPSADNRWLTQA